MEKPEGGRFGRGESRALASGQRWLLKSSSEVNIKSLVTVHIGDFSSSEFQKNLAEEALIV